MFHKGHMLSKYLNCCNKSVLQKYLVQPMEYTSWYAFYSFTFEPIFVFHNAVPNQDYQIIMNFQIVSEVFEGLLFCQEWCFEYLAFEFIANISSNWSKNVLNTYTLYIFNMAFELVDVDCRTANSSFFHCTSRIASYTLNQLCITRNISPSKPSPPSSSPSSSSSSSSSSSPSSW